MSTRPESVARPLPDRPSLRHLKLQAKDLLKSGAVSSLADAQFAVARSYGFPSWPALKAHVDSLQEAGRLKQAIDRNDLAAVVAMMTRNPALHSAPLGYGSNGPLTWVGECRVPREPPGPERLAMARWMIEHGSDVHQGGDGPLMRAALSDDRIAMMDLLVAHGADVNALWHGFYPIIFAACEALQPQCLQWLLDHGANRNCTDPARGVAHSALDYVLGTYARSPRVQICIEMLIAAGATTKYAEPALLDLLRGRLDRLADHLDHDPALLDRRFPEFDFGTTAARRLTLTGATLLHVAAEYGSVDAARLLLDRGADVDGRAAIDESGVGGQTPIFHAASQYWDYGLAVAELLISRGADLSARARLPGHCDRPDEIVEATALEYASRFPGEDGNRETLKLLSNRSAASGSAGV
jgi:ankyrin repeat protein